MTHANDGTLLAYLDGEMTEAHRTALASHLSTCSACRAGFQELRELDGEFRAALVGIDMAVGTASALQQFQARRAALGGAPAAASVPPGRRQERRSSGWPSRIARATLLKAAALALLVAGAAYAAVPGSDLREWIEATFFVADEPAPASIPAPVAPPVSAPSVQDEVPPSDTWGIRTHEGAVLIRLWSPDSRARIRVRLADGDRARIRAAESSRALVKSGAGWIELRGLGGADVIVVEVPRSALHATLEVDGRVYWRKAGDLVDTPGPVLESAEGEVTFNARS